MMVGNHYYIGLSNRTNTSGADQLIRILNSYGMTGSKVKLHHVLHLKTGMAYLENNNIVIFGEFKSHSEFSKFNHITIEKSESYAANCVWINDNVLIPRGFPKAKKALEKKGYPTISIDVSEFQKLDGGISCLSLRF
jgi:dimethylargininase